MIEALLKAIKVKFDADNGAAGLYTAVGGRCYLAEALHREAGGTVAGYPFLVVDLISEAPLGEQSAETIERIRIQFTIFDDSDAHGATTCAQTIGKLRTLFDRAKLDMMADGYQKAIFIREGGTGPARLEGIWQATTDYLAVFV